MAGIETQSGIGVAGRMFVGRGPEELLVVLDVAEVVQVAEDVVGFAAGNVAVGRGFGLGVPRTGVVVAIASNYL